MRNCLSQNCFWTVDPHPEFSWPQTWSLFLLKRQGKCRECQFFNRLPNHKALSWHLHVYFIVAERWLLSKFLICINNDRETHMQADLNSEEQPASFLLCCGLRALLRCANETKDNATNSTEDDADEVGVLCTVCSALCAIIDEYK